MYEKRPVKSCVRVARVLITAIGAVMSAANTTHAQVSQAPVAQGDAEGLPEVLVTARKRGETALAAPVVVQTITGADLERNQLDNLDAIARLVPQLVVGPQSGSVQGGNISLRGIAGPDTNPFGDQAVAFNIDGVQIAKSAVRKLGDFDLDQVEVLEGPQALFYGKNSPAGIITMHTADPTNQYEARTAVSYEIYGQEPRVEGYVSGPVTDTFGVRLAGYVDHMGGYLNNNVPDGSFVQSTTIDKSPRQTDYAARVTLKWNPVAKLDAELKATFSHVGSQSGVTATTETIACPYGSRQFGSVGACEAGQNVYNTGVGPAISALAPGFDGGDPYTDERQLLTGLEINYALTEQLKLTSVSGIYDVRFEDAGNFISDYSAVLPATNRYDDRELSEELRLQSDFAGFFNFTAGLYYSHTSAYIATKAFVLPAEADALPALAASGLGFVPLGTPFQITNYDATLVGHAYSGFMQLAFKPLSELEIDVGGRYSSEEKSIPELRSQPFGGPVNGSDIFAYRPLSAVDELPGSRSGSWPDFSPEATIAYRPSKSLTVFANYKHGFLSGGFNGGSTDFTKPLEYRPEVVKGGEVGVKTALLENSLRVDFSVYTYHVLDMQVESYQNATATISNAASADIKGAEFSSTYLTPLTGVSLHAAAGYNQAKYGNFATAECYNGETVALGCNGSLNAATGLYATQNLSGVTLPRAPRWSLTSGLNYDTPVANGLKLTFSADGSYSTGYFTDVSATPAGRMPGYGLVNSGATLSNSDQRWGVSLLGRNLAGKYYYVQTTDVPFTGSASGGATGVLGDRMGAVARGREVIVKATYKW